MWKLRLKSQVGNFFASDEPRRKWIKIGKFQTTFFFRICAWESPLKLDFYSFFLKIGKRKFAADFPLVSMRFSFFTTWRDISTESLSCGRKPPDCSILETTYFQDIDRQWFDILTHVCSKPKTFLPFKEGSQKRTKFQAFVSVKIGRKDRRFKNRGSQSVDFKSGQKMALREFYFINVHKAYGHITK